MAAENSIIPKPKTTPYNDEQDPNKTIQPRCHGSYKNIFKVALFMVRGRSRKSKVIPVDVEESKSVWRKMVGSMRPFHLQSNNSPPRLPQHPKNDSDRKLKKAVTMPCKSVANSLSEDGFETASEFTNSPSPSHCRYASAVELFEMVQEDEEKEEENKAENEKEENDGNGDEMIDAKAEEFIAQFYQQMRLQSLDVVDARYNEISQRSLGL